MRQRQPIYSGSLEERQVALIARRTVGSVFSVCAEIGKTVCEKHHPDTVVIRSTVPPGTTQRCGVTSALKGGHRSRVVAFKPELLREGTAINDYKTPPYTIIDISDPIAECMPSELYSPLWLRRDQANRRGAGQVHIAWHATKINFANEVGRLARAFGVDGRDVLNIMSQDTKRNVSSAYMRPGFANGFLVCPDLNALVYFGRLEDIDLHSVFAVPIEQNSD